MSLWTGVRGAVREVVVALVEPVVGQLERSPGRLLPAEVRDLVRQVVADRPCALRLRVADARQVVPGVELGPRRRVRAVAAGVVVAVPSGVRLLDPRQVRLEADP